MSEFDNVVVNKTAIVDKYKVLIPDGTSAFSYVAQYASGHFQMIEENGIAYVMVPEGATFTHPSAIKIT